MLRSPIRLDPAETQSVQQDLKLAMRGLAGSVTVISSADGIGMRHAMTATSTTALSMDPPSMLVCINRNSGFFQSLPDDGDFAINILAAGQEIVANLCGGGAKGDERFSAGEWRAGESNVPFLADAQAVAICAQDGRMTYGTHEIVIGRVKAVYLQRSIDPLVYADGGYRMLSE